MATTALHYAYPPVPLRSRWFARTLTVACVLMSILLLGAGLYLMALGGGAAAQSQWVSGEISSRMIGPTFVAVGLAFFFTALYRSLRPARTKSQMARVR